MMSMYYLLAVGRILKLEARLMACSGLINYYAQYQASQASTWGGRTPTAEQVSQLTDAMAADWKWALDQMLRHWEEPPMQ